MTSQLPKIDRWHSEPLDIHRWSDHPEIKSLCDNLYADANLETLEPKGNRKARRNIKDSLRVLILDLYVRWLKDSTLSTGFSKSYKDYKVGSRYNGLFISRKIVEVEALLVDAGYIEELKHYQSKNGLGRSYTTRFRHKEMLRKHFSKLTVELHDIDSHSNEECIILHDKYVDDPDDDKNKKIDYNDDDLSEDKLWLVNKIRDQLRAYNQLLKQSFIDIPSYEASTFTREIKQGRNAGRTQVISLGPDNKYVTRVFNFSGEC